MRISVLPSLRTGTAAAALLLAACRSTRDHGCAPDGSGSQGGAGFPGDQARQPRAYPGHEPKQAPLPIADAGGWRLGGRGAKFLPADAAGMNAPLQADTPQAAAAPAEFLTYPQVGAWPPPGYRVADAAPRRSPRPLQASRSSPKRKAVRPAAPPTRAAEPAAVQPEVAAVQPAPAPVTKPPAATRTRPVAPQRLTDIPRPGESPPAEDPLEKLRRRAEKSLSGE